jgi:PIN domain nuclease of toxin-antitoxin system
MKLLLDTHIFLWFISGDPPLSKNIQNAIRNPENEVYLSVISIWEAIIKYQLVAFTRASRHLFTQTTRFTSNC